MSAVESVIPDAAAPGSLPAAYALGARVANLVLTTQIQLAYRFASDAGEHAQRTARCLNQSLPEGPVRTLLVGCFDAQHDAARSLADSVLDRARRSCGLAYAHW